MDLVLTKSIQMYIPTNLHVDVDLANASLVAASWSS